jgi:hypothetical protein
VAPTGRRRTSATMGLTAALAIVKPSARTIGRWTECIDPHQMHGGHERTKLVGRDQMLMANLFGCIPGRRTRRDCGIHTSSTTEAISMRLDNQSQRRKVVSIEAYHAFLLASILPPTWGVNGLARRGLCDTDECATFLEKANRSKGLAHTTIRLRKPGCYGKGKKPTVILCIETINSRQCESKNNPFKHLLRPVHTPLHLNDPLGVILAPFGLLVAAFGRLGQPEQQAPGHGNARCAISIRPNPRI